MSRNWNQGWNHHSGRHSSWWVIPMIFFVIFMATGAWRSGWTWWIIIPVFFGFVLPALKHASRSWNNDPSAWKRGAWSHDGSYSDMQKRKRGENPEDFEKPKRDEELPVYYVGDDGELIEMPRDNAKRANRGDQPPQYV